MPTPRLRTLIILIILTVLFAILSRPAWGAPAAGAGPVVNPSLQTVALSADLKTAYAQETRHVDWMQLGLVDGHGPTTGAFHHQTHFNGTIGLVDANGEEFPILATHLARSQISTYVGLPEGP